MKLCVKSRKGQSYAYANVVQNGRRSQLGFGKVDEQTANAIKDGRLDTPEKLEAWKVERPKVTLEQALDTYCAGATKLSIGIICLQYVRRVSGVLSEDEDDVFRDQISDLMRGAETIGRIFPGTKIDDLFR